MIATGEKKERERWDRKEIAYITTVAIFTISNRDILYSIQN